jgi:hypothetical protein
MIRTKKRTILLLGLALLAGVPGGMTVCLAQDEDAKKATASKDTELAKQMEIIDEGLKKLRRTLRKPDQNKESLEIINQIQAAAVASKAQTPAKAAKMPEAERQKFVMAYRKDMAAMIVQLLNMEIAVLEGNNDKANEIHKSMKQVEDEGHKKFEE